MPSPTRRRLLAAGLPVLGVLLGILLVAGAAPASAHAVFVSSSPADGSTVRTPPSSVTVTFDDTVGAPAYVVVTGADGVRVDTGRARILGSAVTQNLRHSVPGGTYTVAYRVVSDDGHPVEGQITYTVTAGTSSSTAPPTPAPAAAAPSAAPPAAAAAVASGGDGSHLVHVLGGFAVVVAGAGALVYERLQRRRHPEESAAPR
jgi:methionine-rich copper-binding protein CopC